MRCNKKEKINILSKWQKYARCWRYNCYPNLFFCFFFLYIKHWHPCAKPENFWRDVINISPSSRSRGHSVSLSSGLRLLFWSATQWSAILRVSTAAVGAGCEIWSVLCFIIPQAKRGKKLRAPLESHHWQACQETTTSKSLPLLMTWWSPSTRWGPTLQTVRTILELYAWLTVELDRVLVTYSSTLGHVSASCRLIDTDTSRF